MLHLVIKPAGATGHHHKSKDVIILCATMCSLSFRITFQLNFCAIKVNGQHSKL